MNTGVIVNGGNSPYFVSSGQTDTSDIVDDGGVMVVDFGGVASGTVVSGGGRLTVNAGGVNSGTTVFGGVESGADYTVISPGGIETVFGVASNTTVTSGGGLFIEWAVRRSRPRS